MDFLEEADPLLPWARTQVKGVCVGFTNHVGIILKRFMQKRLRNTFTTASGLLPAGIAVYVQRRPNGVRLETRYLVRVQGFTSQGETRGA